MIIKVQFFQGYNQVVVFQLGFIKSNYFYYFLQLIQLVLSLKKYTTCYHVVIDAAERPYIDFLSIFSASYQQLRWSIKESSYHICHDRLCLFYLLGHAEINDFDFIIMSIDVCRFGLWCQVMLFRDQHDIRWFEVAMHYTLRMKIQYSSYHLFENLLYCELFLICYYSLQGCRQPLHDHHRLLLEHKRFQDLYQSRTCQNFMDIALSDETRGQSYLAQ